MAKLALLCIFALVFIQYAAAGKIKRDAPQASTENAQQNLEKALEQMQEFFKTTFSKENLEKLNSEMQKFGETLSAKGKQLAEEASASIDKLKSSQ